ncbi:Beta-N-acetylglucosaminidase [Ruminococcaceae bacterium YRB3002]|nr:Beta-N-acetylglucosaminidase [Ruminococcaceae bacterium YRB3002]
MKGKRRPEYLYLSLISGLIGVIAVIMMAIIMLPCSSGPSLITSEKDIIARAAEFVPVDKELALSRIEGGMYSMSDYLISVFESPAYLSRGDEDNDFAGAVRYVVYGDDNTDEVLKIIDRLKDRSRMAVISDMAGDVRLRFKATGKITTSSGERPEDVVITEDFARDKRILMGISKASGSMKYSGKDIRADILLDGELCHGYLTREDDPAAEGAYSIAWDTSEARPGDHDIKLILRTGNGNSGVVDGGMIDIPEFDTISNDRVYEGVLPAGESASWYRLNCENRDAYINFIAPTGDIKVSMYDMFGNHIGTNDNARLENEALRGKAQDVAKASEQTGIAGLSNCFFVRVEPGTYCPADHDNIEYMMVQSAEVAYYNGTYMAVVEKTDELLRLVDSELNTYEDEPGDVKLLPINGALVKLDILSAEDESKHNIWPVFKPEICDYAYYMESEAPVKITADAFEGYAASVEIEPKVGDNGVLKLSHGLNNIRITVRSFNGETNKYTICILCGSDDSDFYKNTLSKFPESYYSGLLLLHLVHPEYVFTCYDTGIDYRDALAVEDSGGRSLATNTYNPTYVRPESRIYDAPDWMAVKTEVVNYYLDPRNFLTLERVFMFERQSFNPAYHTLDGIKSMIKGSFMDTDEYDYAAAIYDAAETSGVSPYLLASRILQEMGYYGQSDLATGTVQGYEGYYNYYNIGSYASTSEGGPVLNGAKYARWGNDPDKMEITDKEKSYMLPWDSIYKAITGGALWIAAGYIDNGQDTLYFQKFDVVNNGTTNYDHQYAGYIMMAYSEGYRYYKSYLNTDQLNNTFEFVIPVYRNMPAEFGVAP